MAGPLGVRGWGGGSKMKPERFRGLRNPIRVCVYPRSNGEMLEFVARVTKSGLRFKRSAAKSSV